MEAAVRAKTGDVAAMNIAILDNEAIANSLIVALRLRGSGSHRSLLSFGVCAVGQGPPDHLHCIHNALRFLHVRLGTRALLPTRRITACVPAFERADAEQRRHSSRPWKLNRGAKSAARWFQHRWQRFLFSKNNAIGGKVLLQPLRVAAEQCPHTNAVPVHRAVA